MTAKGRTRLGGHACVELQAAVDALLLAEFHLEAARRNPRTRTQHDMAQQQAGAVRRVRYAIFKATRRTSK